MLINYSFIALKRFSVFFWFDKNYNRFAILKFSRFGNCGGEIN
jgi:hypothetical protein